MFLSWPLIVNFIYSLDPPSVRVSVTELIVNVTDSFSIVCSAFGIPLPSVKWSYVNESRSQ